jgi:hypothetical protein
MSTIDAGPAAVPTHAKWASPTGRPRVGGEPFDDSGVILDLKQLKKLDILDEV